MAEELTFISGSKEEQYLSLLPQVRSLIEGEVDLVANLANVAAALKEAFDFFWVGFYLVKQDQLVLGPFQGPVVWGVLDIDSDLLNFFDETDRKYLEEMCGYLSK